MKRPRIVVIGSANMDITIQADHIPFPGETVIGSSSAMHAGGKGANQAVAAARLGAETFLISAVGDDTFGDALLKSLQAENVDISSVQISSDVSTGLALICVASAGGENSIVVASGANTLVSAKHVRKSTELIAGADAVICSLEVPLSAVLEAVAIGHAHRAITVLNPAPAVPLSTELLQQVAVLTPNEQEARLIAALPGAAPESTAQALVRRGAGKVIVTLGARGALLVEQDGGRAPLFVPAANAGPAVDTTGAGDCYTAALAVALAEDLEMPGAMRFAAAAAAISVTKHGAQESMPWRDASGDLTLSRPEFSVNE